MGIAALDREAWNHYGQPEIIPDSEHAWRLWCEHALVFVARDDASAGKEIVGVVLAFPCLNGSFCLHKVMVREDLRGQGIGSELFVACLDELDTLRVAAFLTVNPENEPAIRLYGKWGFTERKFVTGYYRSNEDRLVLTRPGLR